jgi:polyadenylation factor subunit 2
MLPLLAPQTSLPRPHRYENIEWTPKKHLSAPQPPPIDDAKQHEVEMANARQALDGKTVKKTRPRRTVDYNGGLGRWALVRSRIP